MHEFLVMPCRNMSEADADFAVCCAVPCDADGVTIVARPAGRPGEKAALFSNKYGQSTGVVVFDRVFVAWERVFLAGEWEHSARLTYSYATHHRHTCIAARAGFGDLLIGAGALMCEANGFDPGQEIAPARADGAADHDRRGLLRVRRRRQRLRERRRAVGAVMPDPVFSNIGKLLLANQIYEMHRIAHYVSGGLIVTLPGPDEDHNPETAANLADVLRANPAVPYDKRIEAARLIEDLTASYQGGWYSVISLHGGGSPAAMKQEIWRNYPVGSKVDLVERLLERGVLAEPGRAITANRQPGKCCDSGCTTPSATTMVALPARRAEGQGVMDGVAAVRGLQAPLARRARVVLARAGAADRLGGAFRDGVRRQPAALRPLVRGRQDQSLPQRRRPPPRRASVASGP